MRDSDGWSTRFCDDEGIRRVVDAVLGRSGIQTPFDALSATTIDAPFVLEFSGNVLRRRRREPAHRSARQRSAKSGCRIGAAEHRAQSSNSFAIRPGQVLSAQ